MASVHPPGGTPHTGPAAAWQTCHYSLLTAFQRLLVGCVAQPSQTCTCTGPHSTCLSPQGEDRGGRREPAACLYGAGTAPYHHPSKLSGQAAQVCTHASQKSVSFSHVQIRHCSQQAFWPSPPGHVVARRARLSLASPCPRQLPGVPLGPFSAALYRPCCPCPTAPSCSPGRAGSANIQSTGV